MLLSCKDICKFAFVSFFFLITQSNMFLPFTGANNYFVGTLRYVDMRSKENKSISTTLRLLREETKWGWENCECPRRTQMDSKKKDKKTEK